MTRLDSAVGNVKDITTEMSLYFDERLLDKCYVEHFYERKIHAEAASPRESTHEQQLSRLRDEERKETDTKRKAAITQKIANTEGTVAQSGDGGP